VAMRGLVLGALGVVYGDIGTSPLYTIREAFGRTGGLAPTEDAVLGVLSLVFWALILVVTLKYVILIMRADNRGEGGVLALAALAFKSAPPRSPLHHAVIVLSILGLGLFFGDGLITPAISVLSAVEGLNLATTAFEPYVLPLAVVILIVLFLVQSRGTGVVGRLFGPVMGLWFLTLAVLGGIQVAQSPGILRAVDPRYAIVFFTDGGWIAFAALGAVVLAITGAEALYADMGHFGRSPIRVAWFAVVLPALLLNYFGQGALLLRDPNAADHLFFQLAPTWLLYPLVGLATVATIIASQAVISGMFALARQAIQLGYLPRMAVRHTSAMLVSQIYIPRVNWILMAGVLAVVVGFGSSSNLASAYGVSVVAAMAVDAFLAALVACWLWRWNVVQAVAVFGFLIAIDAAFLAANSVKIAEGAWLPLLLAAAMFVLVSTWRRGRQVLFEKVRGATLPLALFLEGMDKSATRVPGTAVYMTSDPSMVPHALLHNLKHNKVLHQRVVLMSVVTEPIPTVSDRQRVVVERLGKGFFTVIARFGFMEDSNVPLALELCRAHALACDPMETSFFFGRETLVTLPSPLVTPSIPSVGYWEKRLFIALSATAFSATRFFGIPPNRVVELGAQVEL
jgi:KUP system potassium uptake protein